MRRKDREMDRAFALMVLDKCEYAFLSTVNPDGTPYGVPLTIVRAGDFIYFHTALDGQKVQNLRRSPTVCLTAVGGTHIPSNLFTTEFESVIVQGAAEELTDAAEKRQALRLLCQRHVPTNMPAFDQAVSESLHRTGVWRIQIQAITGKRKRYDSQGQEMKFGRME